MVSDSAINGGIYYAPLIRGHVANVKFPPAFLSNASSVTTVRLRNLNLQPQADAIAGLLPAQLKRLSLDNGLFTDMPKGLDAFQNLTTLYVMDAAAASHCIIRLSLTPVVVACDGRTLGASTGTTSRPSTRRSAWTDSWSCTSCQSGVVEPDRGHVH